MSSGERDTRIQITPVWRPAVYTMVSKERHERENASSSGPSEAAFFHTNHLEDLAVNSFFLDIRTLATVVPSVFLVLLLLCLRHAVLLSPVNDR